MKILGNPINFNIEGKGNPINTLFIIRELGRMLSFFIKKKFNQKSFRSRKK